MDVFKQQRLSCKVYKVHVVDELLRPWLCDSGERLQGDADGRRPRHQHHEAQGEGLLAGRGLQTRGHPAQ